MIAKIFPFSAISLALCGTCSPLWAQRVAPDAGQVLRDLQQVPSVLTPQAVPLQRVDETPNLSQPSEAKVLVKSIVITGNKEIPSAELQLVVASFTGTEQSLSQLNVAARQLTAYYRSKGFAVARAYLPVQDITDGAITIAVIEGHIANHKISNRSLLSDDRVEAYLSDVKDGDVVRSEQIDRGLLLLQDTPGVSTSRATLQPGASVGTSELLIEVNPANPYSGNVVTDNYGSRYTGEYRVAGTFNVASPLKIGDQFTASLLTAGENLNYARLAYQVPVGSDGLKIGAAYSDLRYKLGKEFDALEAHGTATSASVFATYPFIRSQFKNLSGTVSLEEKRLKDYVDATATFTPKKITVMSLGLSGSLQDSLGGGGISGLDLSLATGTLSIDSPTARTIDAASAQSDGHYTRFSYGVSRLQRLMNNTFLAVSLKGQTASKNLDSSEKFSLGGINGVRAYPQGEASGDAGSLGTVELRHNLMANVQATLFYDWGQVTINRKPFGASTSNHRHLAGVGVGLNATLGPVQIRSALAWRTDGGLPTSIPASAAKRPTLWMQAALAF